MLGTKTPGNKKKTYRAQIEMNKKKLHTAVSVELSILSTVQREMENPAFIYSLSEFCSFLFTIGQSP